MTTKTETITFYIPRPTDMIVNPPGYKVIFDGVLGWGLVYADPTKGEAVLMIKESVAMYLIKAAQRWQWPNEKLAKG